jgi:hypothetical protein
MRPVERNPAAGDDRAQMRFCSGTETGSSDTRKPQKLQEASIRRERLAYLARRLHRLGERPLYEFIREIIAGANPIERLEAFARIDSAIVKYLGADRMPPSIHTILVTDGSASEETRMLHDLRTIARLLDGEVSGSQVLAPGPRHKRRDRSLIPTLADQDRCAQSRSPMDMTRQG